MRGDVVPQWLMGLPALSEATEESEDAENDAGKGHEEGDNGGGAIAGDQSDGDESDVED